MADFIFILYIILMVIVCWLSYNKLGKELCYEYMAFKTTQKYMHSKGLRRPPREWLD